MAPAFTVLLDQVLDLHETRKKRQVKEYFCCLDPYKRKGGQIVCFSTSSGTFLPFSPQMQDLAFTFLEFHKDSVDPFLQPVEVPLNGSTASWCIIYSSQFQSSENLLRVCSASSSRSLLEVLRSINSWGISLVTGLQLDLITLITTLWAWQFS